MGLWRNLRTVFQLARRVDDLEAQWDETRIDLADRTDKLDRLLRRLTLRETRSAPPESPTPTTEPNGDKERLRALARERGLMR